MARVTSGRDAAAVQRAMMATGSWQSANRRMTQLSGGELQRVYLARALSVEASVLLLDEPTAHLDPPHQEEVIRLLRQRASTHEVCVVSAIHDLSMALAADHLIVLGQRGLIGAGSVSDALSGDWLSVAFDTQIDIVDCGGSPLWRPTLRPRRG